MAKLTAEQMRFINSIWTGAHMAAVARQKWAVLKARAAEGEHCAHAAEYQRERSALWSEHVMSAEHALGIR